MKLRRSFLFALLVVFLVGCESQQKVTDVGNPPDIDLPEQAMEQIGPSIAELQRTYQEAFASANVSGGGQATGPANCQSDTKASKKIVAGAKENEVILENFFSYSESTKRIVAAYQQGIISLRVADNTTDLACEGKAELISSQVVIDLACDIIKPVKQKCVSHFISTGS